MVTYFPKTISNKGLLLYILSLAAVSIAFNSFAISFMWMVLGLVEVSLFFLLSSQLTKDWQRLSPKRYESNIFGVALLLRIVWVIFSYFFYMAQTGQPFEYDAADAIGYHELAKEFATIPFKDAFRWLFLRGGGVSDTGYNFYLIILYKIFGPNVIITRLIKACLSAYMCVLLYRLVARTANEQVGRMAGIFAVLMPNLILYCGLHLKETEMLFLTVAFLERADYTLRSKRFTFKNIVVTLLLAGSLFFFRTVLGAVAVFAFISAVVFSPSQIISKRRKVAVGVWVALAIVTLAGGTIWNEVESYWVDRGANQDLKRMEQTMRGNQWAKYATGAVMAPMIAVLPFSTMVDTAQENQLVMHGGNFVRNFMGVFVLISLFSLLFVKKNWREFSLVGAYTAGYLGIIALSGFANAERFLLPGLPGLIVFWTYGISQLSAKNYKFVKAWYIVVVLMEVGWAYFKIGSRGLL